MTLPTVARSPSVRNDMVIECSFLILETAVDENSLYHKFHLVTVLFLDIVSQHLSPHMEFPKEEIKTLELL